jgi:hypothetical protein
MTNLDGNGGKASAAVIRAAEQFKSQKTQIRNRLIKALQKFLSNAGAQPSSRLDSFSCLCGKYFRRFNKCYQGVPRKLRLQTYFVITFLASKLARLCPVHYLFVTSGRMGIMCSCLLACRRWHDL